MWAAALFCVSAARQLAHTEMCIRDSTKGEEGGLPPEFGQVAALPGTLVFLMGLNSLPAIVEGLLKAGRPQSLPAAVIENGTLENARTCLLYTSTPGFYVGFPSKTVREPGADCCPGPGRIAAFSIKCRD